MSPSPYVSVAVEGQSDTGMVESLLNYVGLALSRPCVVKRGASNLDKMIPKLSRAPIEAPWIVFRDSDNRCPVELKKELIGSDRGNGFELRLACSMTEAWILADANGFAEFFRVSRKKLPAAPDGLQHAKNELLRLCQHSRSTTIQKEMVRADGSTGPLYVNRVINFCRGHWDVARACERSPSLTRAVARLTTMRAKLVSTPSAS